MKHYPRLVRKDRDDEEARAFEFRANLLGTLALIVTIGAATVVLRLVFP